MQIKKNYNIVMKLSIIIPVYNCENTIERTFESIANQLNEESEAIFVNDGSNDNSIRILFQLKNKYKNKNITLISQENKGLISARKKGIDSACGEYCWAVDGGDKIVNRSIERILQEIYSNNEIDIFYINHILIENNITTYRSDYNEKFLTGKENLLLGHISFPVCFKIVKRSLLLKCLAFNNCEISMGEDACQTYDLLGLTDRIAYIKDNLYVYIKDGNSMTLSNRNNVNIIKAIEYIKNNTPKELEQEFQYFAFNQLIVTYLLFGKNRNDYEPMIHYYKNLKIKNNKYIKNEKFCLFIAFIKNKTHISNKFWLYIFDKLRSKMKKRDKN